jgi:GAGA factor
MSLVPSADKTDMADEPGAPGTDDEADVYEIAVDAEAETEIPLEWRTTAQYQLEEPARCPYCRAVIRTLRVLRLTRTQVSFTSTLPRGGRAMICPECDRILSAEVSGLL